MMHLNGVLPKPRIPDIAEPPHDFVAEQGILGCIVRDPDKLAECMIALPGAEVFWDDGYAEIYRIMLGLAEQGLRVEVELLMRRMWETPDKVPTDEHFEALVSGAVPAALPVYIERVRDCYRLRRLDCIAGDLRRDIANTERPDVDEIGARLAGDISRALACGQQSFIVGIGEALDGALGEIRSRAPAFLKTGMVGFDQTFGGIPRGAVTTVMGTPGSGKSTLCLQIILHLAACGERVMVFSNEMSATRVAATLLTMAAGIAAHDRWGRGNVTADEMAVLERGAGTIRDLPIELVEKPMHAGQIYAHAKLGRSRGVSLVFVDYLQDLPPVPGYLNGEERVSESMRRLKGIARDTGITTLIVSQLDKATSKARQRPTMHDGLYSSRIEQASDFMVAVYREHMNDPAPTCGGMELDNWREVVRRTEIIVLKNKVGGCGAVLARLDTHRMTFEEQ